MRTLNSIASAGIEVGPGCFVVLRLDWMIWKPFYMPVLVLSTNGNFANLFTT